MPSADTRRVYVSSSGSDKADGLSPSTPKRSLAVATALLRHGFPDWLLLKRGDTWQESLGHWKKSGRSPSEPMVVSTWGHAIARPLLQTGATGGIWTNGGGGSPATIDHLALVGIHFQADGYTGGGDCIGASLLQPGSHLLIEDCAFEGYSNNLVFQGYGGRHTDFKLRRSVIVDAWTIHAIGGHSEGLYAYAVDGLLIEENLFDHNGWNEQVPGAGADVFSHNVYIDNDNTGVVVRGNVIANASSHGMQLRPGGTVVNNLFVRNSIALSVGGGDSPEPGGVTADVRGNVILDGKDIDVANPRGWGMWFANIKSGCVRRNVIAHNTRGNQPCAITLDGDHRGGSTASIGVHDLALEENVLFDWGGSILVDGDGAQVTDVELRGNDVQEFAGSQPLVVHEDPASAASLRWKGNRLHSRLAHADTWRPVGSGNRSGPSVSYPDPTRGLASYSRSLEGAGTEAAFFAQLRAQSRASWRPELTAAAVNRYLRGGFGLVFE